MSAPLPSATSTSATSLARIVSLDQFRGYTVAGMLLVNFLGGYACCPVIWKHHHTWCSYADTIMPQFLFAVGFSLRLSFLKQLQSYGRAAAWRRMVRRVLSLGAVAIALYTFDAWPWQRFATEGLWPTLVQLAKRDWFQTLMHIVATTLWVLPVLGAGTGQRLLWLVGSVAVHAGLSYAFNFEWVNTSPNGIDGGPLGFLTWSVPALVGTWAHDIVRSRGAMATRSLLLGAALWMTLGYALSCGTTLYNVPNASDSQQATSPVIPAAWQWRASPLGLSELPFVQPPERVRNYWMMSQRSGTPSYLCFGAGFSLLVYAVFHRACDTGRWRFGLFTILGANALAAYVWHGFTDQLVTKGLGLTSQSSSIQVALGFAAFFGLTTAIIWGMNRRGWYWRM